MSQPQWKFAANLGDADPIEHGGQFVYTDSTGVYRPEVECLRIKSGDTEDEYNDAGELEVAGNIVWEIHRFTIEDCTYGLMVDGEFQPLDEYHPDGILSDNKYHPDDTAWFAKPEDLSDVANFVGLEKWELIQLFLSEDVKDRAYAWLMVADYHGIENLDSYPIEYDNRKDLEKRYGNECIRPVSF